MLCSKMMWLRNVAWLWAQVREAQHIKTKERVAIKIISRARMSEEAGAEDKGARHLEESVFESADCLARSHSCAALAASAAHVMT